MPFSRRIGLRMSAWSTSEIVIGAALGGDPPGEAAAERDRARPARPPPRCPWPRGRAAASPSSSRIADGVDLEDLRDPLQQLVQQLVLGEVGERGVGDPLQRLEDLQGQRLRHGPNGRAIYARAVRLRRVKTLSSAERSPNASAPVSTAASPRLETSTRGGYGQRCASSSRIGREQQVAVRADAAAEHDQLDVRDGRDRHDVAGDPARLLGHHRAARARRPRARRRRSRARRRAARARVASRPSAASAAA